MTPEELIALADRIDYDKQWRKSPFLDPFTPEERDRCDAGVSLRRYASELGIANEDRAKGAMYIRGWKLEGPTEGTYSVGCGYSGWRTVINRFNDREPKEALRDKDIMVAPMLFAAALPRVISLFERDRKGEIPDSYLVCGLGTQCGKCKYLSAIDEFGGMSPEAKDEAKAWTCSSHIAMERSAIFFSTAPVIYAKSSSPPDPLESIFHMRPL